MLTLAVFLFLSTHPVGLIVALAATIGLVGIATVYPGALTQDAINKLLGGPLVAIPASGAIDPHTAQRYMITKAGLAAMTLAAPTAGVDDGLAIQILSSTAFAHTITATGLLVDGAAHVNQAALPAAGGGAIDLVAYQGKWYVENSQNITFS
jgi:hypothetical protein